MGRFALAPTQGELPSTHGIYYGDDGSKTGMSQKEYESNIRPGEMSKISSRFGTSGAGSATGSVRPSVSSTPSVGTTGVSNPSSPGTSPSTGTGTGFTNTISSGSSGNTGLLDFDKMFDYQKKLSDEDKKNYQFANEENYKYRSKEANDQQSRDYETRTQTSALATQRDIVSADLERGTMRSQQQLAAQTKDGDLRRAMSIVMGGGKKR